MITPDEFSPDPKDLTTPSPPWGGEVRIGCGGSAVEQRSMNAPTPGRTLTQPESTTPPPLGGGRAKVVGDPLLARQRSMCTPTLRPH